MREGVPLAPKARTLAFRDSVVLFLNDHGVRDACRPALPDGLNGRDHFAQDRGEVGGTPWALNVHRQQTLDLSGCMDRVQQRARQEGRTLYATILYRKGHTVSESYVAMPLSVFAIVAPVPTPHVSG